MIDETTDGEIVRRIARRAEEARGAEEELCRRFGPRVRLYALRHLRTEEKAADLVQAVLLAVIVAARSGRIEDPDRVDRFVLGTCRNTAHRVRQGDARAKPVDPGELDVQSYIPPFESIDVGALYGCMAKLDARSRAVLHLSFQTETAPEDIARRLSTTAGNVRVVRHRAIAQLRACLEGAS
jgi:RNA polymerase sigma-70 factor (ECF subfamily)